MSVNAALFERQHEPEFFAKKCRHCRQPAERCECADELRDQQIDRELLEERS